MFERFGFDEKKKFVKREKRKRLLRDRKEKGGRKVAVDEPLTSVC